MNQHGERRSPHRDEAHQAALAEVRAQHITDAGGRSLPARERAVLEKDEAGAGRGLAALGTAGREQRGGEVLVAGILELERAERRAGRKRGGEEAYPAFGGVVDSERDRDLVLVVALGLVNARDVGGAEVRSFMLLRAAEGELGGA